MSFPEDVIAVAQRNVPEHGDIGLQRAGFSKLFRYRPRRTSMATGSW
jgi:hypothetical protein